MSEVQRSLTRCAAAPIPRRKFLRRAAAAGGLLAAPWPVPGKALGRDGAVPPSEKIVLGGIGIGGRGSGVLGWMMGEPDVQCVAVCDAKKAQRERVKQMVDTRYGNNDCQIYRDIREFLALRTDIDAVLIATGDRWHAFASVLAMRAGKDVYSEKPSSMTVAQGRAVVDTARRYRRIYQTGTQRLSEGNFIFANELVRTGRLGKVHVPYKDIILLVTALVRKDTEKKVAEIRPPTLYIGAPLAGGGNLPVMLEEQEPGVRVVRTTELDHYLDIFAVEPAHHLRLNAGTFNFTQTGMKLQLTSPANLAEFVKYFAPLCEHADLDVSIRWILDDDPRTGLRFNSLAQYEAYLHWRVQMVYHADE